MPASSPFTDWVYEAWEELVLDKGDKLSLEEKRQKWSILHQACYVTGEWTVGLEDSRLVASLGSTLAMQSGEYMVARDLLRELFAHKGLTEESLFDIEHNWSLVREAIADILCGNVADAIERIRKPLHHPDRQKVFLNIVRNDLIDVVHTLGLENQADEEIVTFVAEIVGCYKGLKRLSMKVRTYRTYSELCSALDQTFRR